MAVREVGEVRRQRQTSDRGVAVRVGEPSLLDTGGQVALDGCAARLGELVAHLPANRLEPGLDADLRYPRPHRAEADDTDFSNLHYASARASVQRNETSPWPGSCWTTTSSRT